MDGRPTAERLFWADALRIFAALAVVTLHVAAALVLFVKDHSTALWWAGNIADSSVRWAVPAFVMLSGALLLDPTKLESTALFYRKRIHRLLLPLAFWSAFYLTLPLLHGGSMSLKKALVLVLMGQPAHHLWYVYMAVGLAIFTPFLRIFVASAPQSTRRLAAGTILLVGAAHAATQAFVPFRSTPNILSTFVPYIGYFLLGYEIRRGWLKQLTTLSLATAIVGSVSIIALGTRSLMDLYGQTHAAFYLYHPLSPTVIILSTLVFLLAARIRPVADGRLRAVVGHISAMTFGIYLVHVFFIAEFAHYGFRVVRLNPVFGIPLVAGSVFLCSYLAVSVLARIPLVSRTVA